MKTKKIYLVAGGDGRFVKLASLLTTYGKVYTLGLGDTDGTPLHAISALKEQPDVLILPTPAENNGFTLYTPITAESVPLDHLLDTCHGDSLVFGGKLSPHLLEECRKRRLKAIDYLCREDYAVENAVPTAEGTIRILLDSSAETLFHKRVLLIGFGRISKALMRPLSGLGMHVTVAARKREQRLLAQQMGAECVCPIDALAEHAADTQILLNTVPATVVTEAVLKVLPKDCLLIDLASLPGGIDLDSAKKEERNVYTALGLPGRFFPDTSAQILLSTLRTVLKEDTQ